MRTTSFIPSQRLTIDTVEVDRQRLIVYLRQNRSNQLQFDLSSVTHCDSAGLALIIEAKKLCQRQHKAFEIMGMPQTIHALAEFCGVDNIVQ